MKRSRQDRCAKFGSSDNEGGAKSRRYSRTLRLLPSRGQARTKKRKSVMGEVQLGAKAYGTCDRRRLPSARHSGSGLETGDGSLPGPISYSFAPLCRPAVAHREDYGVTCPINLRPKLHCPVMGPRGSAGCVPRITLRNRVDEKRDRHRYRHFRHAALSARVYGRLFF